jgi:2-iminobutanoate/2-iminopropanoate deaminase
MKLVPVATPNAPAAIGPYSQAVKAGNQVFCSGQVALDPASGQLVGKTAAEQCEQVMKNLGAVLAAAGSGFDRVARTTIFLVSMSDFGDVNAVYGRHFPGQKPARATVAVKELPKGALVEIDCIAFTAE